MKRLVTLAIAGLAAIPVVAQQTNTNAPARLPEQTVTATRLPERQQPLLQYPGNVTVLTQKEIGQSPALTLPDLLRQEVGVSVTDTVGFGQSGTKLTMRGYSDKPGTLVLVDGVKVNDAGDATFLWNSIPLQSIERIEVIRGGASTIYGEGALGGVINIITKKSQAEGTRATTGVAVGNLGYYSANMEASAGKGPYRLQFNASRQEWDGWRDTSEYRMWSTHIKPSYQTPTGSLTLDYFFHHSEGEDPDNLTQAQFLSNPRQKGTTQTFTRNTQHRASLGFDTAFDGGWSFQGKIYGQDHFVSGLRTSPWLSETEQPKYGVTLQAVQNADLFGRENELLLGTELEKQYYSNYGDGALASSTDNWTGSLFLNDRLKLTDRLILTAGTRFDHREWDILIPGSFDAGRKASVWSPKASLAYEFAEKTTAWGTLSRAFRLPGGSDIGSAGYDSGSLAVIANPTIQPTDARSVDFGLRTERSELLRGSVTYYYSHVKDDFVFNPFVGGWGQNQNFDAIRQGVELNLESRPTAWLNFYFNTAYSRARFHGGSLNGNRLPHIPEWQHNFGVNILPAVGWKWTLEGTKLVDQIVLNDINNVMVANDYFVANTKLSYSIKSFSAFVAVNNLFEEIYEQYPTSNGTAASRKFNPAPGRNYQVGLAYTF